jgi:ABC-2 type transport system permease protein
MPIHDQSYRHWEGKLKSHSLRWWVITLEGLKIILRRKLFILLILVPAIIQFFVFGGIIYGINTYGVFAQFANMTPEFFYRFCFQQTFFIALICVFGGSGLIANDLKSNALQLYLSKPLTRFDYIAGKIAVIFIMLECITFIPGILLFFEHAVLSQDLTFLIEQYWIIGAIFLFSLVLTLPATIMILAFSSMTKSYRYAAIMFMAIAFGTPVIGNLLYVIFRARWMTFIPYWKNLDNLGRELFRISKDPTAWYWSSLIILFITVVCIWIMYRRIRGVDIVK